MKIACISDLHLSSETTADSFQHKENCFLHFLDHLESSYDQIILNGDIYDPCKSLYAWRYEDQISQIKELYPAITDRFVDPKYIQLAGNHDYVLEDMGFKDHYTHVDEEKTKYMFFHGHQLDRLRSHKALLIVLTTLADWLENLGWCNAEAYLTWFGEKMGQLINVDANKLLKGRANGVLFGDTNKRVIVMGHSHQPPIKVEFNNTIYLNSGACLRKRLEYVHIDTNYQEYDTRTWSETNQYGIATKTYYNSKKEKKCLNI